MFNALSQIGRTTFNALEELGYACVLLAESLKWLLLGGFKHQPVSFKKIIHEMIEAGVKATPIVTVLCFSVGMMLALQGLETLKPYGAQAQVVTGIAISVMREFSALIVAIVVAGRSGSAIAARIGTMQESQEIDALRVMGIEPVRYIAAPMLVAMMICVPALTIIGDIMGLLGGAVYTSVELDMSITTYLNRSFQVLHAFDVMQGLIKSFVFALIISLVGVSNGFQVSGGAEGVGRATTRSVVMSISCIIITDMIFTFFLTR